jgi:mono/diheme cytochrome c family protein
MDGSRVLRYAALTVGLSAAVGAARGTTVPAMAHATAAADTVQVTQKMIDAGKGVFHGAGGCFACHGMNMQGSAIAPPLDKKGKPWLAAKGGTYDEILKVVEHGVPATAMLAKPNGINDEQAKNVAAYVWAVNNGKAKP